MIMVTAAEAAECAPTLTRFFDILVSVKCPACRAPAWIRCNDWRDYGGTGSNGTVCLLRIPACGVLERQVLKRLAAHSNDLIAQKIRRAYRAWRFLTLRRQ